MLEESTAPRPAANPEPPASNPVYHIIFLHTQLRQKNEDIYLVDLANALQKYGHKVTIFTSVFNEDEALDDVHPIKGHLEVLYSGWWLPNSICGSFKRSISRMKSAWMAWRMVLSPPAPIPKVVVLDSDPVALFILSWFSKYKTVYVHHFPQLYSSEFFHCSMYVTPNLLTAKALGYADEIVVQTKGLQEVFQKSFPKIKKSPHVLHPCVDTGMWVENCVEIKRIIPDLPKKYILFVAFGEYRRRTNFKLILDTLEHIFSFVDSPLREEIHMVIAGTFKESSLEQRLHYSELINRLKEKPYASQVTLLKQTPTVHKKTLIKECTAVIHPTRHDLYPGPILAALNQGKPIVSVNCGFARDVVMHRLTGILVEPDPHKFAKVMIKLAVSPTLQRFIGDMSRNSFTASFSFERFSSKLNSLVVNLQEPADGLK